MMMEYLKLFVLLLVFSCFLKSETLLKAPSFKRFRTANSHLTSKTQAVQIHGERGTGKHKVLTSNSRKSSDVFKTTTGEHIENDVDRVNPRSRNRIRRRVTMVYPGTKWCGMGNVAKDYNDIGSLESTDSCCRDHDLCKHKINAFDKKYNHRNYRIYTITHCDCDDRFRTCLKEANTTTAIGIGRWSFNILEMPCFTLVDKLTCVESTLWGRCLRKEVLPTAILRESTPFLPRNTSEDEHAQNRDVAGSTESFPSNIIDHVINCASGPNEVGCQEAHETQDIKQDPLNVHHDIFEDTGSGITRDTFTRDLPSTNYGPASTTPTRESVLDQPDSEDHQIYVEMAEPQGDGTDSSGELIDTNDSWSDTYRRGVASQGGKATYVYRPPIIKFPANPT